MKSIVFILLLAPSVMLAQPGVVRPIWEMQIDSARRVNHHASAGLFSVQSKDSVTFYDVWTGDSITTRQKQGEHCFVDSALLKISWISEGGGLVTDIATTFTDDLVLSSTGTFFNEFVANDWTALTSSRNNLAFFSGRGKDYFDRFDMGVLSTGTIGMDLERWVNRSSGHHPNPTVSRSGLLCGGVDVGETRKDGVPRTSWDRVVFNGLLLSTNTLLRLSGQRFAWLDDFNNILIASDGLYHVIPNTTLQESDSIRFLRALPQGDWYWHAPFADWTYALACKSDSSQVSIVSLVTDSVVAQCVSTSRRIDTIYTDVQRNYIITYDAVNRVLSGFVVDTSLILQQLISSVGRTIDDGVANQGAQSKGLIWPNPATEVAHIRVPHGTDYLTITSALGMHCVVAVTPGAEVASVPLLAFSNGVYVVRTNENSSAQMLYICR